MIENIVLAEHQDTEHRDDQIFATRALDRVLLAHYFVVPHWHITHHRIAYWKRITHPDTLPPYAIGFSEIWWQAESDRVH